jgi:cytoskeletal protein CcmA (bactofilin family)
MSTELRKDLKYLGKMTSPGGVYRRVNFEGEVTIDGDLDCLEIKVNGILNEKGNLKSNTGKINGYAIVDGNLESEDINVNGELRVDGNMSVDKISSNGKLVVKWNISSEKVDINGELKVKGNCEVESFYFKGAFSIEETLNSGNVNVRLYGPSEVNEIGGEKIHVQKGGEGPLMEIFAAILNPLNFYKAHLKADTIEGDDIYLEHTTARVVRGNTVNIGDGCEIDLVEYKTNFKKTPGTSVLQNVKI